MKREGDIRIRKKGGEKRKGKGVRKERHNTVVEGGRETKGKDKKGGDVRIGGEGRAKRGEE